MTGKGLQQGWLGVLVGGWSNRQVKGRREGRHTGEQEGQPGGGSESQFLIIKPTGGHTGRGGGWTGGYRENVIRFGMYNIRNRRIGGFKSELWWMDQANLGLVVFQYTRWPQQVNAGLLLGVNFPLTTQLPTISSLWPSARTLAGLRFLWLGILTLTSRQWRGTSAQQRLWWSL